MSKFYFLSLALLLMYSTSLAQDCVVSMKSIKGTYEGACNKGKAEGKGKAMGIDTYDGDFKAGVPHGTGKYTWQNGNHYQGKWNHGKKEGEGIMVFKLANRDSIISGFWQKDEYFGEYEKPYILHSKSIHVVHFSCRRQSASLNQIDVAVSSTSGGNGSSMSPGSGTLELVAKPVITNISVAKGNYVKKVENDNFGKKIIYTLENVNYPFRAQIEMGKDFIDIEFFQSGNWVIELTLTY